MRKLFHLGMIACIFFSLSSCTKSASDLVANEKSVKTGTSQANNKGVVTLAPNNGHLGPIISSNWSKFYPFVNQPYAQELGEDNGAVFNSGALAVFYVILSEEVRDEIPVSATLSTIDDATGQSIETYKLIYYRDAGTVDAIVPDELAGTPFMFALVNLGSQYIDKAITLSSSIEFNNGYSPAQITRAFSVTQ
jgi:hypothetical protein